MKQSVRTFLGQAGRHGPVRTLFGEMNFVSKCQAEPVIQAARLRTSIDVHDVQGPETSWHRHMSEGWVGVMEWLYFTPKRSVAANNEALVLLLVDK